MHILRTEYYEHKNSIGEDMPEGDRGPVFCDTV